VLPLRLFERLLMPLAGVPSQCAVCRSWDGAAICGDCVRRFAPARPRCRRCAIEVPAQATVCGACLKSPPVVERAIAAVAYDYPWDRLIARFKFHDGLDLTAALADRLLAAWQAAGPAPPDLVLPIPLAAGRLHERGYNQAWELARRIARRLGVAADPLLLLRARDTLHQIDLPFGRRAANVRGAFGVDARRAHRLAGRRVAIVDDVMTTGATLEEAARTLLRAGAVAVEAWVVARTPRPHGA
jgi:ComF family protein